MYKTVGLETGVSGANPHQLVNMLFDAAVESISLARKAIQDRELVPKIEAISKALRIVDEGLKANLNMESGGELASNLHDLYGYISIRLALANLRNDDSVLEECLGLIEPLRQAWKAIGPEARAVSAGLGVKA